MKFAFKRGLTISFSNKGNPLIRVEAVSVFRGLKSFSKTNERHTSLPLLKNKRFLGLGTSNKRRKTKLSKTFLVVWNYRSIKKRQNDCISISWILQLPTVKSLSAGA